jgi:molybdopterin molybdotransferase
MAAKHNIGLAQARALMLDRLPAPVPVACPIEEAGGLVLAQDCLARVNCPATATSLKDGYAVCSSDLAGVSEQEPVKLELCGAMVAGGDTNPVVTSGKTVCVMTGARIPAGADAVLANEFTQVQEGWVYCTRDAQPGRNILAQGHDVAGGKSMASAGELLTPAKTGLLAAAGIDQVKVLQRPSVGLLGIGDEVVCPGQALGEGQLYASNLVTLKSWLGQFRMQADMTIVPDNQDLLCETVTCLAEKKDVILTSGGAWMSDRDLTIRSLEALGGEVVFHRIRMGPGKAVAMVLLGGTVVFCLPGGPPSNEMAFLQIALPGLLHLAGLRGGPFRHQSARLTETVSGHVDWTQFLHGKVFEERGQYFVTPLKKASRLQSQAEASALIEIPEGTAVIAANKCASVQCLSDAVR